MNTQILEEIGLTKTEIKIYLALLELGQSTTTNIIKKSQVPTSKVYEFLERLIKKGLVSYVLKSNKKCFSAAEPASIKELLKEQKEKIKEQNRKLDNLLPELNSLKKSEEDKISSEIYEGLKGAKSVYEKIFSTLKKGETQYIIGAPKIGNDLLEGFLLEWHKKRIKKNIRCKYIYDSDAKGYGKIREEMKLTEVKYLPKNMASPVWIEIFRDNIIIGHLKGSNTVLFLIKDKEIAESYLNYFNLIWKISK